MRRTLLLAAGFLLSAGVLLAALVWISRLTLGLEAREAEARRRAAFEERVRLALWRMDSALAALLAEENARPVDGGGWGGGRGRGATPAGPGPGVAARPYLAGRFEIDAAGRVREWASSPSSPRRAAPALDRDALLSSFGGWPLSARQVEPGARRAAAPRRAEAAKVAGPPVEEAPAQAATAQAAAAQALAAQAAPHPVRQAQASAAQVSPARAAPAKVPPAQVSPAQAAPRSAGEEKVAVPQATPASKKAVANAGAAAQKANSFSANKAAEPSAAAEPAAAASKNDPVAREMLNQSMLNRVEFEQREKQSPSQGVGEPAPLSPAPHGASPLAPASSGAPASSATAATAAPPPPSTSSLPSAASRPSASSPPSASAPPSAPSLAKAPARPPPVAPVQHAGVRTARHRPPPPASPAGAAPAGAARARRLPLAPAAAPHESPVASALTAVWVGDDLVLAKRVERGAGEALEGVRLDGPGVRAWLLAGVRDLLPLAGLFPLRQGEAADPGRRLALLPLRLDPGPLPASPAAPEGPSAVRLGLVAAFTAVLLSTAAAALLLTASLRLARRRADFVSAVTHELRTPLTTFRLYSEMLADDMVPGAERRAYLDTLRDEAARLGHLVENVLAFARLERGRKRMTVEEIGLGELVGEAASRLAQRAERDGLGLDVEVSPAATAARVRIDRLSVERILQNLVDNACKYGRSAAASRLQLTARLGDRGAVLTLRDHGRGLPRDRWGRRRLFRPFHRSAEQAAGAEPGIGLGLALSRRLARGFGGDLRVVEPAGGGAAFELRLPLAPAESKSQP
jgi:signal transduction histidine kinase